MLDDIKKALSLINEEKPPNKKYKTEFGWIETDGDGFPIRITFTKPIQNLFKELTMMNVDHPIITKGKIKTLYGMKVLNVESD